MRADVLADIPDIAGQLARDRNADYVVLQSARAQSPIAMAQAQLCSPGDRADLGWLAFLPDLQWHAHACREAVIPRRFDQDAADVTVAGSW